MFECFRKELNKNNFLGPFDTIQPQMCDTIINRLHSKRLLKRHHIYLLINPVSTVFIKFVFQKKLFIIGLKLITFVKKKY